MLTAERVIEILGLEPLPFEGGAFRETYRSVARVSAGGLVGEPGRGERACGTQIYYLLRKGETSALHRVRSDEVFHHYLGDSAEQLWVRDGGRTHDPVPVATGEERAGVVVIGSDLEAGERPQVVVPADVWQGARLKEGGAFGYALLGCSVSPGFEWEDFELVTSGRALGMERALPEFAGLIRDLTPVEGRTRA